MGCSGVGGGTARAGSSLQHMVDKGAAGTGAHLSTEECMSSLCVCSEWYYARSPFLSPQHRAEILGSLYELDGVTFHLALCRADLDIAWPMFSE